MSSSHFKHASPSQTRIVDNIRMVIATTNTRTVAADVDQYEPECDAEVENIRKLSTHSSRGALASYDHLHKRPLSPEDLTNEIHTISNGQMTVAKMSSSSSMLNVLNGHDSTTTHRYSHTRSHHHHHYIDNDEIQRSASPFAYVSADYDTAAAAAIGPNEHMMTLMERRCSGGSLPPHYDYGGQPDQAAHHHHYQQYEHEHEPQQQLEDDASAHELTKRKKRANYGAKYGPVPALVLSPASVDSHADYDSYSPTYNHHQHHPHHQPLLELNGVDEATRWGAQRPPRHGPPSAAHSSSSSQYHQHQHHYQQIGGALDYENYQSSARSHPYQQQQQQQRQHMQPSPYHYYSASAAAHQQHQQSHLPPHHHHQQQQHQHRYNQHPNAASFAKRITKSSSSLQFVASHQANNSNGHTLQAGNNGSRTFGHLAHSASFDNSQQLRQLAITDADVDPSRHQHSSSSTSGYRTSTSSSSSSSFMSSSRNNGAGGGGGGGDRAAGGASSFARTHQSHSRHGSTSSSSFGGVVGGEGGESSSDANASKDQIVLHVKNLDYKISSDEWKRILLENFRKHCKESLSVSVVVNPDKSLLGVVKLASKDDARLAISCLHHKKIGYKRLNVNIAFSATSNSPRSKIVALLRSCESNEMLLSRFIELYELRYNQTITLSELFKLKDIVHISHSKDGHQSRQIKLILRNYQQQSALESEMQELLHTPYCSLHSHPFKTLANTASSVASASSSSSSSSSSTNASNETAGLPNVVVSLRAFKSTVHKLLNDHGGQMPLLSFMDCYKCCIYNSETAAATSSSSSSSAAAAAAAAATTDTLKSGGESSSSSSLPPNNNSTDNNVCPSYALVVDAENGVPLEHLITCAQDVQIQYNEAFYKQLQWENDKVSPGGGGGGTTTTTTTTSHHNRQSSSSSSSLRGRAAADLDLLDQQQLSAGVQGEDTAVEETARKLNQFAHEIVELLKGVSRCLMPLSKFNNEYHKKYGRQCRVADYGYTKLYDLIESVPHIIQILDGEFEKKLTLTHRVQVRRFSNDLLKVLKSHAGAKQMFADEYPAAYERHYARAFDIRDYGVCYLEDMLAELPDSVVCRKEIDGRTFIHIPRIVQLEEERVCTRRLAADIVDMLREKARFSIQFNKFIPNFHHHFGRQCKLSHYGFTKLVELLEAMPNTVQLLVKDTVQFVQLTCSIMLDLIAQNVVRIVEESGHRLLVSLAKLEELYNGRHERICYADFGCLNFAQLYSLLPLRKHCVRTVLASSLPNEIHFAHYHRNLMSLMMSCATSNNSSSSSSSSSSSLEYVNDKLEWCVQVEAYNDKDVKRMCKVMLKKLMDAGDEHILAKLSAEFTAVHRRAFYLHDLIEIMLRSNAHGNELLACIRSLNQRTIHVMMRLLADYLSTVEHTSATTATASSHSSSSSSSSSSSTTSAQQAAASSSDALACHDEHEATTQMQAIVGHSELFTFAKQIRHLFRLANVLDMNESELEAMYKQTFGSSSSSSNNSSSSGEMVSGDHEAAAAAAINTVRSTVAGLCNNEPTSVFPHRRLGFVDVGLLFSQGLNLVVTIKKYNDKRICLNKEFWPANFLEIAPTNMGESFNSPETPDKQVTALTATAAATATPSFALSAAPSTTTISY